MTGRGAGRAVRFLLALAVMAGAGAAARADDVPTVVSPLRFDGDRNGVNLTDGRTVMELPVLSVPAAPNLRFDRLQNAAPYVKGTVQTPLGTEIDERRYSIQTGTGASDSFQCENYVCTSITGTGSTFRYAGRRYQQSGSGAVWTFNLLHSATASTQSPYQTMMYYASSVAYPNGEVITYSYATATLIGDPFPGRLFYRPATITSNLGYSISLTFAGNDFNGDMNAWGTLTQAAIYSSANPGTPLGRLTYSGNTITDLGGRVYTCAGCTNTLGIDIEVSEGSMQLPGEGSPARQVARVTSVPQSAATPVGSVTQDGVQWSYAYDNLRGQGSLNSTVNGYLYDHLTVNGPNNYHVVYDVGQRPIYMSTIQQNVITRVTDSINRSTSYQFDMSYRPVQVVFPEQNRIDVTYDEFGNVTQRVTTPKPNGGSPITETASYPTATCIPNNTSTPLCWRPTWSRDGLQRQTDYAYNALGQLTEQIDPADANGVRRRTSTSYETYNGVSRRTAVRICADTGASCGTSAPIQTEYVYAGPVLLPTSERRIDGATILTTTYSYDAAGRLLSTAPPSGGSDATTYNRYDVHGRKTWEIGARSAANGLRIATRYTYRASDDKPYITETGTIPDATSEALSVFRRTDVTYDGRRYPIREAVSGSGTTYGVTDKAFDDSGRLVCTATRMNMAAFGEMPGACLPTTQSGEGPDRITVNSYDNAGQLLQVLGGYLTGDQRTYATYTYSANGRRTSLTDANNNRAEMTWDGFDRQSRWIFPSPTTMGVANQADYEEYSYDPAGNRTLLRKRDGRTIAFGYDGLNRLISKTYPQGGATPIFYSYNLRDLQLTARFNSQSGDGITNSFDGFGRQLSTTTTSGSLSWTLSYLYDLNSNRIRITHPDGNRFETDYDALGRPTTLWANEYTAMAGMGYYSHGGPAGRSLANGATSEWGFDPIQRLNAVVLNAAGTSADGTWSFLFNPANQITSRTIGNDSYSWTSHYAVNRNYTVNGRNQYTAAGSASFTYDTNGNLTADGTNSYAYDIENRLVSVSGAQNASFAYDPLGRLAYSTGDPQLTRFLWDGDELVGEYDYGGNLLRRYAHWVGADVPLLWYEGATLGTPRYLHADQQGSIVLVSDQYGNPSINRYDEYGILAATNVGRFAYTGQIRLPEIGMYYYKARIYSPTLGRFLQTDPVGYDDQLNLYEYVGDDPVNNTDPEGTHTFTCTIQQQHVTSCIHSNDGSSSVTLVVRGVNADGSITRMSRVIGDTNGDIGSYSELSSRISAGILQMTGLRASVTVEEPRQRAALPPPIAASPVGRSGNPNRVQPGTNTPATINGREYSGHALDQMQGRGIPPSAVENTIRTGRSTSGNTPGTTRYYDPRNNLSVITNTRGGVVTVRPGN